MISFVVSSDDLFKRYIPYEHASQVAQQMVVLNVKFCIYVKATECSLAYHVLFYAPNNILSDLAKMIVSVARTIVNWAHAGGTCPYFYSEEDKTKVGKRIMFWKMVNDRVHQKGPLPPTKKSEHGAKSIYSNSKAGVCG